MSNINEHTTKPVTTATLGWVAPTVPTISFVGNDNVTILKLEPNGDIYVHGKLVENDKEVVNGLRAFLLNHGY